MLEKKAKQPFCFFTSSVLVEIIGKRAHHLKEFVQLLKKIDANSIFYHVHHAFREYHFAPGEYSNDFARWIEEDLEESRLAERIAAINIRDFIDLGTLRAGLVKIIEEHLANAVEIRKVSPGREFYFLRNSTIVMPTKYKVNTLSEFMKTLNKVGMRSLYYHFFDARLRLGHHCNDFSNWIERDLGFKELAAKIEALDPYFITMDELKTHIINLCKEDAKKRRLGLGKTLQIIRKVLSKN